MIVKHKEVLIRFLDKVKFQPNGCVSWQAGTQKGGYGEFSFGGKSIRAHRFAFEQFRNRIPTLQSLDHLCRNPGCVNPWHLEIVSHRENCLRGNSPLAQNARKTHCLRGHEFSLFNTYQWLTQYQTPARTCQECRRQTTRLQYAQKTANGWKRLGKSEGRKWKRIIDGEPQE